jgi:hypothetical protein
MDNKSCKKVANKYFCEKCDYNTSRKSSYDKHLLTAFHNMDNKSCKKVANKYFCEKCDYNTSRKSSYDNHLLTAFHNMDNKSCKVAEKVANEHYKCNCGKVYKYNTGLYKHKTQCLKSNITGNIDISTAAQLINTANNITFVMDIIKENQDFKSLVMEQMKENHVQQKETKELMNKMVEMTQQQLIHPNNTTINHTTNHNNNQTFNLNLFLNETCKNAMNIREFIENIKITFEELLAIGNTGFVNGLSDIFVKRLRDLEIEKRPIHCTDSKRETIYFKENDEWSKDDKENKKLKGVIEKVEYKNVTALREWCNENPDSKTNNTPNNLLRDKIYLETLQGDNRTRDKIIKNISKEIMVHRNNGELLP